MSWTGRILAGAASLALLIGGRIVAAPAATGGDRPAGYWYGTDSSSVRVSGRLPGTEPVIGGAYGGYVGMIGDWAKWLRCADYPLAWSPSDSAVANSDFTKDRKGVGTGAYWFMGGPGVDPHYRGTTAEAYRWGEAQAARALHDVRMAAVKYPVLFMDVELPGSTRFDPVTDNGWVEAYSSACGGRVAAGSIAPGVDRADFDGFAAYVRSHSSLRVGVYSSPAVWATIFGTGADAALRGVYEWTYAGDTSSLRHPPVSWCLPGTPTCADFFGGVSRTSRYALMWQWSGGGGTSNGVGDFDQIDARNVS